jgi:UDP-glucose 4-epimerase
MRKKEKMVVFFGFNEGTLKIIKTVDQKKYGCLVIDNFDNNYDELLKRNIPFIKSNIDDKENINRNLENIYSKYHYHNCYFLF